MLDVQEWVEWVREFVLSWVAGYWLSEPVNATIFFVWLFVAVISTVQIRKVNKRKSKGKVFYGNEIENARFFRMIRIWATVLLVVDLAWTIHMYVG